MVAAGNLLRGFTKLVEWIFISAVYLTEILNLILSTIICSVFIALAGLVGLLLSKKLEFEAVLFYLGVGLIGIGGTTFLVGSFCIIQGFGKNFSFKK